MDDSTKELVKFPSFQESKHFELMLKNDEIKNIVSDLAKAINEKYKGEELVLVCPLRGGLIVLSELAKRLTAVNVYIDFMMTKSVGSSRESRGSFVITQDITSDLYEKNVLIVEEIVDSARMLDFIVDRLKLSSPKNIEVLTLLDRPYKRKADVKISYIGKTVEDTFLVGMGLDLNQYGRNLKNIYSLKYPN